MSDLPIAIITTRLPPAMCGVGAHSALLRKSWPMTSTSVEFLVVDGAAEARLVCEGDRVTQFDGDAARLALALERLGETDLILHYAARAYQRWGCPVWLPGVLSGWKRKSRTGRLLVFVHEVPGEARFTSRHFWLGKVDAWILRRLASIADIVVTNTEAHRRKLEGISGRNDIHLVPVGSNIELVSSASATRARREFVLFGLPFGRWQTLRLFDPHIRHWQATGQFAKLHIIGPDGDEFSREADRLINSWSDASAVVRHGVLPATEVSRLLQSAQFALTNVTRETWSKSGAFMACAVHGCVPVISGRPPAEAPLSYALAAGEVEAISDAELTRRAHALRAWYAGNADWPVVAANLAALLKGDRR